MAKNTVNDLNYGHLGLATYHLDSNSWSFGRRAGQHGHLKLLGSIDSAISPPRPPKPPHASHASHESRESANGAIRQLRSAKSRERACVELIRRNPDLSAFDVTSLSHNELVSEEAEILSQTSTKSRELIAFGQVLNADPSKDESNVEVVAFASGECQSILKLAKIELYAQGWNDSRQVWLSTPEISSVDSSQWDFNGAQIEQIVFANPPGKSGTFLAVRTRLQTTVFRPRYRISDVSSLHPSSRGNYFDPSNLDLNPIITFSTQATGGQPHAYAAFNPWYPRSFAIVTEQGSWYTWELEGMTVQRNTYTSNRTAEGNLLDDSSIETDERIRLLADLWARISWVIDVNTIVVCCRRRLSIFDITGRSTSLTCDGIISMDGPEWILDVKRDPVDDHQLIVLTSSRLVLLSIQRTIQSGNQTSLTYRLVLSWPHFRNEEDTTMSLSVTPDSQDLIILVPSQLNSNVTMFRVSSAGVVPIASSKADPAMLSLSDTPHDPPADEPDGSDGLDPADQLGIVQMVLELLEFRTQGRVKECQALRYSETGLRFFQTFILRKNFEVQSCLLYCEDIWSDNPASFAPDHSIIAPQWKRRPRKHGKSSAKILDDFFIVGNDNETRLDMAFQPYKAPRWSGSMHRRGRATETSAKVPSLQSGRYRQPAEMFVDALNGKNGEDNQNFPVTVDQFQRLIDHHVEAEGDLPRTLFQLIKPRTHIRDIDKESQALEDIIQHFHDSEMQVGNTAVLRRVSHHNALSGTGSSTSPVTVDDIFDRMLSLWISPLPAEMSLQRVAKERLIRQATAELSLKCCDETKGILRDR